MFFSVITVTYNAEKTLERTIRSVVGQGYPRVEYIIIDGNSTDGTGKIIEKYADRIASFVCEPDNGLYEAMNKGLSKASGDYVWFLNAGDTFYAPDTLEILASKLDPDSLPDILYGETAIVDDSGNFKYMRRLKVPEKLTRKSFRKGMLVCHQAFIVKKSIAPEYDLHYRFSGDFDWCIRCMEKATNIFNSRQILVNYLEEGLTTENHRLSLKERYRIMKTHYDKIPVFLWHLWFAARFLVAKFFRNRK
ncbi:MAG: glycosyltransferase [Candidatus Azobacteroides sp.]|nr:glycosyltransferase [Candidatus Azobacteroides sp.]